MANVLRFLIINLRAFAQLPPFPERNLQEGGIFRACKKGEVNAILKLRNELDGQDFSGTVRFLLKFMPGKCCTVILDRDGALMALSVFYFNDRDILEATVHEGFIGVKPECGGKGLATTIRKLAAEHFSKSGAIKGISSRITLSNLASVSSGYKAGYEMLERYKDETTGEERGYFMNRFRGEAHK